MYIYGSGGHAKVIFDSLISQGFNVDYFIDDNKSVRSLMQKEVHHQWDGEYPIIVGVGDNLLRKKIVERLKKRSLEINRALLFGKAIHCSSVISPFSSIGEGTVVMQGVIIQTCAIVGKHCIINTASSIDHDCIINDYVHISPHSTLCGNVCIGEGSWIGAGTTIIPDVTIGKWCIIGAGSVVTKDIPDGYLAFGNRCRLIKELEL